jgi:hypothetical protein
VTRPSDITRERILRAASGCLPIAAMKKQYPRHCSQGARQPSRYQLPLRGRTASTAKSPSPLCHKMVTRADDISGGRKPPPSLARHA